MKKYSWKVYSYTIIVLAIIVVLSFFIILYNLTDDLEDEYTIEVLVQNLDTPWAIDFMPDGTMIFTERPGRVNLFDGKESKVIANIDVTEISESGLLGIAVDPEFENNSFVYLYYTYEKEGSAFNRVSRFMFEDKALFNETILLDNIPAARFHDGGRIKFGPDG